MEGQCKYVMYVVKDRKKERDGNERENNRK